MNIFKLNIVACNPNDAHLATTPLEAVVDTESELTWLPAEVLREIGVEPRCRQLFATPDHQTVERDTALVILRSNGCVAKGEVVFAEPGDPTLLGARTLQAFGVKMDDDDTRFVSLATIVAFWKKN